MSDLIERLRAHAALHRGLGVDDYDEQAQWARDLLTAVDEIERLTAALRHEADCVEAAEEENERLTAERDELRRMAKDAARYRWLRGREDGRYMTVYAFRTDIDEVCLGDELDAAIDAAMGLTRPAEESNG